MTESKLGSLLVVDDIEANRDMLSRRLVRHGYEVIMAAGGEQAIELIQQHSFDAILLDIMMPVVSGWDVLKWIRENHSPAQLPVIMATAKDASEDVVRALQEGANDYVTKPLDMKVVLARVNTHVKLKQTAESLTLANDSLIEANVRLKRDLESAARVQQSELPPKTPLLDGCEVAWAYKPCDELAGDFLDVFNIDEDNIGLYLLDVSGHGVQAALMSVAVSRAMKPSLSDTCVVSRPDRSHATGDYPLTINSPAEVAEKLNERFPTNTGTGQYFTFIYGIFNKPTGQLLYTSAGHPSPVIIRSDGTVEMPDAKAGFPIGVVQEYEPEYERCPDMTLTLHSGDRILFYSDGVTEAQNLASELLDDAGLLRSVQLHADLSLDECVTSLLADVLDWTAPNPPNDDVSILALEVG